MHVSSIKSVGKMFEKLLVVAEISIDFVVSSSRFVTRERN